MRRVLVAVLAVASAVAIVTSLQQPGAAPRAAATARLGTPLWSVRRTPQPVVDAVGAQHLQTKLLAQTGGNRACFAVADPLGSLAASNTDTALTPASTLKLLTATAALDRLGPDFHFTTTVQGTVGPGNGTVPRLFLVGHGDPLLATPERIALDQRNPETAGLSSTPLATLADRIHDAGVRSVPGGVVGVDGRYDRTRYQPNWTPGARAAIGPVGALTVNDGFGGPSGTGAAVADPALNAATELSRLLVARGVAVGSPSTGSAPTGATEIAHLDSAPLPEVLTEMLSASDNLTAEMLVRELGARAGEGTTARGLGEVHDALTQRGIDLTGVVMGDGSGLDHADAVPCRTLMAVLDLTRRPRFGPIRRGLSIAAVRGTLAASFHDTPLAGKLQAKTGTLDGVSGLAGFVADGRPLTFALLLSGTFGEATAASLRESMATTIGQFPQTDAGDTLVPTPSEPIAPRACPHVARAC